MRPKGDATRDGSREELLYLQNRIAVAPGVSSFVKILRSVKFFDSSGAGLETSTKKLWSTAGEISAKSAESTSVKGSKSR